MMRSILIGLAVCVIATSAAGQEARTLLGGDIRHGGFGGPVVKFTEIDNNFGVLVGGRGGWIINDSFVLGAGGYGLANEDTFDDYRDQHGDRWRLLMGYGGLDLEYIVQPHEVVHLSVGVLIGAGGLMWDPVGWHRSDDDEVDAFFVTEPSLHLNLNVTKHFRVGFGASYRFVDDVELVALDDSDIAGAAGVLTFKFGGF